MQFECGREVSQVQCEGQWSRQRDEAPASVLWRRAGRECERQEAELKKAGVALGESAGTTL